MGVELPADLQDFLIQQGRSVYFCGPGADDDEELKDELALEIGLGWKRIYSDQLSKLASVAKECLLMLDFAPSSPEAAVAASDYFWAYVVRSLDTSVEIYDLVALKEEPHPRPYLCLLGAFYGQGEDHESCRRYFELLVELGQ